MTRAPSRDTSDKSNNQLRERSVYFRGAPWKKLLHPRDTNRPDCARAEEDTVTSPARVGWCVEVARLLLLRQARPSETVSLRTLPRERIL